MSFMVEGALVVFASCLKGTSSQPANNHSDGVERSEMGQDK